MKITEFSAKMPNHTGVLSNLVSSLAEEGVTILALSVAEISDDSTVRMITTDPQATERQLIRKGYSFIKSDVVLVEMSDPTAIAAVSTILAKNMINIYYAYTTNEITGRSTMVLRTDDMDKTVACLSGEGIPLLPTHEVYRTQNTVSEFLVQL